MRQFFKGRSGILLVAILGLAAITLLASGLREVSFRPGQILAEEEARTVSLPVAKLMEDLSTIPLWKQLAAWAIIFLIVLILSTILSPDLRRKLLNTFISFSFILAGLYFLAKNYSYLFRGLMDFSAANPPAEGPDGTEGIPPPVFEAPQVSPLTAFLISAAVAVILVALGWAVTVWWKRRQAFLALQRPKDELADIARDSLDRLSQGGAWDDVITESYMRMAEVVQKRRGLIRQHAVTTSEFAEHLERAGLPAEAVRTLTRLFESVRYGARRPGSDERSQAVACLTAILRFCGEPQ